MSEHGADTPEQVLKFVPTEPPRTYGPVVDEAFTDMLGYVISELR